MTKFWKILSITILSLFLVTSAIYADETSDLKLKIDERNNQIKQLEEEINQYNLKVQQVNTQAKTLQNTIKTLDLTQKKLSTDIILTDSKISKTNLTITQINNEITDIAKSINLNKKAIASLLQEKRIMEDTDVVVSFLSNKNISDLWTSLDNVTQVGTQIKTKSDELRLLKNDLTKKQSQLGIQKNDLTSLKQDLGGQKQAVETTKQQKSTILTQTKNKEQMFKTLIATKEQQKAQFEKELYDFESQLDILIDPSKYAVAKHGVLSWPLDKVFITQLFGKTVGAEKLYTSGSHNGVDFKAVVGTRVKAALNGVIVGLGNTDQYPGCLSFGKWVMIKHPNGLSTVYGHLSAIMVHQGQQVNTGDIIGYSGNTGYTTGPHLHFGVYATQGVKIEQYNKGIACRKALMPIADVKAYLDPMVYLPVYGS